MSRDLRAALERLDAPMDWDRDSPEDRLSRFVNEVREVARVTPDRIAELEEAAASLADLIISYADLTHRTVIEGGDWRDIANEWGAVVAAARESRRVW